MSKREENKFLKIQTCVMRVDNICCDGCQKKVKKVLSKIDGVYATSIDAEARKVSVTGDVDPAILIKRLNKAGKHAELWPAKGGKNQNLINQLQKLQPQLAKGQHKGNEKPQKGGGGAKDEKKGHHSPQPAKGFMDLKFPSLKNFKIPFKKDTKKAKSDHSHKKEEQEVDEGSDFDEFDEYDEFDDEELDDMDASDAESYDEHPKMAKSVNFQPITEGAKDKKPAGGGGGGGGKGGEAQLQNKSGGGKRGGGGNKDGGKNGHGVHDSKSGGGSNNSKNGTHAHSGNPSNKGGGGNLGVGGGLPIGQPHMMGQLGNMQGLMGSGPPPPGLPAAAGYSHGGLLPHDMLPAGANPYQQQYLQALMQQQQQQQQQRMMMMNGQFPPSYGYGQPAYMPHPQPYSMFSDENPDGCSVM